MFGLTHKSYLLKHNYNVAQKLNKHQDAKGIFSVSLFGNMEDPNFRQNYILPLLKSGLAAPKTLHKWYVRVYLDPNHPSRLINELLDHNIEVFIMEESSKGYNGTMWRFLPAGEDIPFMSHDSDMVVGEYDSSLPDIINGLKKWVKSDKDFVQFRIGHINFFIPVSAGTWGSKNCAVPDIQRRMEHYDSEWLGCDEAFLSKELKHDIRNHGYVFWNKIEIIEVVILLSVLIIAYFLALRAYNNRHKQ